MCRRRSAYIGHQSNRMLCECLTCFWWKTFAFASCDKPFLINNINRRKLALNAAGLIKLVFFIFGFCFVFHSITRKPDGSSLFRGMIGMMLEIANFYEQNMYICGFGYICRSIILFLIFLIEIWVIFSEKSLPFTISPSRRLQNSYAAHAVS